MTHDRGLSVAEWEALRELPVTPYIGMTQDDAETHARREGRQVRVLSRLSGPRHLDLVCDRVNVELDADGVVVAADAG